MGILKNQTTQIMTDVEEIKNDIESTRIDNNNKFDKMFSGMDDHSKRIAKSEQNIVELKKDVDELGNMPLTDKQKEEVQSLLKDLEEDCKQQIDQLDSFTKKGLNTLENKMDS